MKAYVLHGIDDLRYESMPMPQCPEGWALIKVKASGICSSDIGRIFTKGTYHFPTIPGHEFSGVVSSVGSVRDAGLIGRRVAVFPLIPCRKCVQCSEKHYEMCSDYDYLGSRRDGGFAEFVAVPVWNLLPLGNNVSFVTAAMFEPLAVAYHAIKCGNIVPGNNVGIVGTGMIGIGAAQWAKKMGAEKVTVIGRNEAKRKLIESCGVEYVVSNEHEKDKRLYDVVVEAVGTVQSIEMAVLSTTSGGTLVLMGNPSGDIVLRQDVYWKILRKQLKITGTWNSQFDGIFKSDWTEVVAVVQNNDIDVFPLVSHCFNQEDLPKGLELMRQHNEPYCKVMTLWND